jgi:2-oxo-4-hydroxy-4-carboxy--5-ureidoimidazoline (OHCU) decarboxylase
MVTGLDLERLDSAPPAEFVAAVAPLFEGAPGFLARLAAGRPDASWAAFFDRARAIAHAMPEAEQIELLDAHPRLGAPPGSMSALSRREQGHGAASPGTASSRRTPPRMTPDPTPSLVESMGGGAVDVAAELARLNAAYETRFGFRYCVFVAGRPHAALVPDLAAACVADRDEELHRGLDAVIDIAIARRASLAGSKT